jgi:hypothetical protein
MEEDDLCQKFVTVDRKLRMITTGGKISHEDQALVIQDVITDALEDPTGLTQTSEIDPESSLGVALHDTGATAYFSESQFRIIEPSSTYRYIATTGVANCLAVFVSTPNGPSFGAHLNLVSMYYSLEEVKLHGGEVFQNMSTALKKAFDGVEASEITASVVGGWTQTDNGTKRKHNFERSQGRVWSFSSIVLDCLHNSLPGITVDTSKMNQFKGVSWEDRTQKTKLKCIVNGEAYRFVVLDRQTGIVRLQTTNLGDFLPDKGGGVMFPPRVLVSSLEDLAGMHSRVERFRRMAKRGGAPDSILQQVL